MRYTFRFSQGEVTADLQAQAFGELHTLLTTHAIDEETTYQFLRQVAYFDENQSDLIAEYAGGTIVIYGLQVNAFERREDAFNWVSENDLQGVYVLTLPTAQQMSASQVRSLSVRTS